jgi:hypothetical protein
MSPITRARRGTSLGLALALMIGVCLTLVLLFRERDLDTPARSTSSIPSPLRLRSLSWDITPALSWLSDVDCDTLLPTEDGTTTPACHWGCVDARDIMMVSPIDGTVVCVPPWVGKPRERHMLDTVERRLLTLQREDSLR